MIGEGVSLMPYRVFIGSSRESIQYAEEIQRNIENSRIPDIEAVCWPTVFQLGIFTLESLLRTLKNSTFGIFVLAPDDYIEIRNQAYRVPRDNVILEMGMFIAGVGRENTFFMYPRDTGDYELKLPSDLDGVTGAPYSAHQYGDNVAAKVSGACVQIKNAIRERLRLLRNSESDDKKKLTNEIIEERKNLSERLKEYQKQII